MPTPTLGVKTTDRTKHFQLYKQPVAHVCHRPSTNRCNNSRWMTGVKAFRFRSPPKLSLLRQVVRAAVPGVGVAAVDDSHEDDGVALACGLGDVALNLGNETNLTRHVDTLYHPDKTEEVMILDSNSASVRDKLRGRVAASIDAAEIDPTVVESDGQPEEPIDRQFRDRTDFTHMLTCQFCQNLLPANEVVFHLTAKQMSVICVHLRSRSEWVIAEFGASIAP